jgi:CBS domain-containing protein
VISSRDFVIPGAGKRKKFRPVGHHPISPPKGAAQDGDHPKEALMRKCSEVMTTNPVYCLPTDHVAKVAQVMKTSDIGSVPIVESEKSRRLVGIVTDRDLVVKLMAEGRDIKASKAEEVMTRGVVTCHAEDDFEKALDAMSENQLRRIPVVDDDGQIVGIIAQADIATRVDEEATTGAIVKEISQSNLK